MMFEPLGMMVLRHLWSYGGKKVYLEWEIFMEGEKKVYFWGEFKLE